MGGIGDHNRDRFDDPAVVEDYAGATELTPCEVALFERHIPQGSRVLDLGVGTGRTTPWLLARSSTYVGIDLAPNMIEEARRRHPGVDLRVMDAADLSAIPARSMDVVVFSYNGIDYLDDGARSRCLDECARVLKREGRLILSTHNPRAIVGVPGPNVRGIKRVVLTVVLTLKRTWRLFPRRSFFAGEGWVTDPVRGGLETHMATPDRAVAELVDHDFVPVDRRNGDDPAPPRSLRTPWWYLVVSSERAKAAGRDAPPPPPPAPPPLPTGEYRE